MIFICRYTAHKQELLKVLVTQLCLTLCDPVDCSLPSSSVHGILQARILEWIAFPFSSGSSWPKNRTGVSCIAGGFFTNWEESRTFLLAPPGGQHSHHHPHHETLRQLWKKESQSPSPCFSPQAVSISSHQECPRTGTRAITHRLWERTRCEVFTLLQRPNLFTMIFLYYQI